MNKKIALICCVMSQFALAEPVLETKNNAHATTFGAIADVMHQSDSLPIEVKNELAVLNATQGALAFEEKALSLTEKLLASYGAAFSQDQQAQLAIVKNGVISTLKKFKISGMAFTADPNFAFVYNNQNPTFTMTYAGPDGLLRTRRFESSIDSWGLRIEATIRLDCIFFTDDALDYFEAGKQLDVGLGIEVGIPVFPGAPALLYAPFTNAPGGIMILSFKVGLQSSNLSIVTGGYIKPVATA
jgi:hypothetical protein